MVSRTADDAFMALLRSYHSQRFCRAAALGARNGVTASSRFSTSALLPAASPPRSRIETSDGRQPRYKPPPQAARRSAPKFELPQEVAIVGAGITGLTTAHYLAKWLPETSNITIYEAADRTGGWINTQIVDMEMGGHKFPVRFERGPRTLRGMGKDTFRFDDLVLFDLMRDLDMIKEYRGIRSPPRYVYYPDHLAKMTPGNILTEPVFKGAIPGFLTFLYRRHLARNGKLKLEPDMSVAEFIKLTTGRPELVDNMVSAMIHGIWGGDADKLSMRSFMPAQWWRFGYKPWVSDDEQRNIDPLLITRQEKGLIDSLGGDEELRNLLRTAQKDQLVQFKNGMSSLPDTIERELRKRKNVHFKLGEPVLDLRYHEKSERAVLFSKSSPETPTFFNKIISTTTSNALYRMTGGALRSLAGSPNVSIMAINLWYPDPNLNANHKGVGYLVPRSVDNPEGLLGVFFDSDVLLRAEGEPEGTKLFVLMGGHHWAGKRKPPSEDEAIQMAKSVVERHLGIPADTPCWSMAHYAKNCIPQHHVGHWERMDAVSTELAFCFFGTLAVAGGSYTPIGVTSGIRAGYDMALHIARSAQEHVGETGLGLYQEATPQFFLASRRKIHQVGRDISPEPSLLRSLFQ
ncbi:protoporphyrinogen oxidase [Colletotrichum karsti]|uniref:Protoporphyrinogen oxidase n=1 Tax=Colletotrichum karsti TaxID=1095194 RepID=A0A9P6IBE7_9PEZI|nr:protoporphyrinogen oxidase [Colletotrichum karsti]KAF9879798.1 protoporphyrinogen oxidase [Colletotrichum karsti]